MQGIGRVRIEPYDDHIVDVFLTHTCASDYNSWYRQKQVDITIESVFTVHRYLGVRSSSLSRLSRSPMQIL